MIAIDVDRTHYDTLGINLKASPDDIKAAYRRLTKVHHPDLGGDVDVFAGINVAYEELRDHRSDYDAALAAAVTAAAAPEPAVVVPDDWEPDLWDEEVVEVAPKAHDVAWDDEPVYVPRPQAAPDPVYVPATAEVIQGKAVRIIGGTLLVLASFAVSTFAAGPAGVAWVVYLSCTVCFAAFWRAVGLPWPVLVAELVVSGLLVWGAYAGHGFAGAVAAVGVLAPIIVACEMFFSLHKNGARA